MNTLNSSATRYWEDNSSTAATVLTTATDDTHAFWANTITIPTASSMTTGSVTALPRGRRAPAPHSRRYGLPLPFGMRRWLESALCDDLFRAKTAEKHVRIGSSRREAAPRCPRIEPRRYELPPVQRS